jgi:hypothetical protein
MMPPNPLSRHRKSRQSLIVIVIVIVIVNVLSLDPP